METNMENSFSRKWGKLVVLSLALAIVIIDSTILNVSLRTLIIDLHTDIQSLQWVITAYSLILAAFTITGGRLGDIFGRKRMFMLGAAIFAVGSFIASISQGVGTMIAGEAIIEGIGAALMMPATASLLVSNYKGRDRSIAFGVWGGIAGASSAIGPIIGGWLTSNYSWRWAFRINILVAAVLLIGSFLIKESRDLEEKPTIDFGGIFFSALGLLSIVYGFIESSTYGWFVSKKEFIVMGRAVHFANISVVPFFIVAGIILLVVFVLWERFMERRGKTPLVSLELFQNRQFTSGMATTGMLSLAQAGLIFSVPIFLQSVRGFDAFHTGLAMLPLSISMLIMAPFSAFVVKYLSPKRIVQLGLGLDLIGFMVMRASIGPEATAWSLAPGFAIFGTGMGLMMAQISNLTLSAVSVEEAGEASGVNNTFRQVGATFGSAVMGAILLSSLTGNLSSLVGSNNVIPPQAKSTIISTIQTQTSQVEFGNDNQVINSAPSVIQKEFKNIVAQATSDADRTTLLYGIGFILLTFLVSLFLPDTGNIETERSAAHH